MCHYFYIPANLDIEKLLVEFPFRHIDAFNPNCLYYILSQIVEIHANNKDLADEAGYTSVNAEILKKWIGKEYPKYVQWLIDAGVIETDNRFITGKKSRGYRYCQEYCMGLRKVLVTSTHLIDKLDEYYTSFANTPIHTTSVIQSKSKKAKCLDVVVPVPHEYQSSSVYAPAAKWYQSGLIRMNMPLATEYNDTLLDYKLADKSRWDIKLEKNGKTILKNPIVQHHANCINIDRIACGIFNAHPDDTVHRYHSTMTNTKKELRNAITIDNQDVTVVDLSNSQPTLLTLLLNPNFLAGSGSNITHTIIPEFNLQSTFRSQTTFSSFITLCKNAQSNGGEIVQELNMYKELVKNDQFYPAFRHRVEQQTGKPVQNGGIKHLFFTVLFTDNHFIGQPEAAPKRVFKEMFPNLYKLTSLIKSKNHANLPILLQRLESYIMFHLIIARISREKPDLPIIPIHDSIATIKGLEGYIEQVMREELAACLGFTPHFKRETWERSVLEAEIYRMKMG